MKTKLIVRAVHEGGMRVLASDGEFHIEMDYPVADAEIATAPTPLTMLLASLAACSLNSVLVVLKRMQQPVTGLGVEAHATRSIDHPTVLTEISLEFTVKGKDIDSNAVSRALHLSEERLCPIWNMLKPSTPITASFVLEHKPEPAAVVNA